MSQWKPIETAPKDGTVIQLWAEDAGGPYPMFWDNDAINPLVSNVPGLWVLLGGGLTWSDQDLDGSPTDWMPYQEFVQ